MYQANQSCIYKDNFHKKITGVCAGIARHFDIPRWQVRAVAVVSLLVMPHIAVIAYIVATLLLRSR